MKDNLMKRDTAWYPKNAEQFHGRAFIKTLERIKPELYERASNFFEFEKFELGGIKMQNNLGALRKMAQREEEKEDSLLRNIFQQDNYRSVEAGQRIQIINSLYAAKDAFAHNIAKIQAIKDGKGGGRIDVTTQFAFYLKKEIEALNIEELSEESIKECIERALYDMFFSYEKNTDNQPYAELAHALDHLKSTSKQPWIIDELFSLYFGVPFEKAKAELEGDAKVSLLAADVKKKLWGDYLYGSKKGNVLEAIEAMTQEFMHKNFSGANIYRTGVTGMKADNIITYNIEVDVNKVFEESWGNSGKSVRARSVDRLQELFNRVGTQGGYIVEISDKNYSLTSATFAENKGFAAQTNFKLSNFQTLLERMKVRDADIKSLMFVLANTDSELIGGPDSTTACDFIATYIGYFLFDDLQIDENFNNLSTQAVHLFNLDGVYIPLSVFLRATIAAFEKSSLDAHNYVNVAFNSSFSYKTQEDGLQEEDWTKLYKDRITKSSLDIHFFGDFVNYIKTNIKL